MALVISLTGQAAIAANGSADAKVKLRRRESPALALLVANRHRPVTREELAEGLWGDDLPRSWDQLVRGIAVTLRAGFTPAGHVGTDVLRTDYRGYQLHLPADTVIDVEQAAEAVDAATGALGAGDPGLAEREAGQAVEIAARQFLPGASGAWVERRQAEVRELYVHGLEVLAEAAEALHDWAAAVKAAEEAVELEPFRDSSYRRLMSAHSRSGSRSGALRA